MPELVVTELRTYPELEICVEAARSADNDLNTYRRCRALIRYDEEKAVKKKGRAGT